MNTGVLITQMKGKLINAHIFCTSCFKMTTIDIKNNGKQVYKRKVVCEHCHETIEASVPTVYRSKKHGQYRRQYCHHCGKYRYEKMTHDKVNIFPKYHDAVSKQHKANLKSKKEADYFTICICDKPCDNEWSGFFMVPPIKVLAEEIVLSGEKSDTYQNNDYKGYISDVEYKKPKLLEYTVKNSKVQYRLDFKCLTGYTIHISKKDEKLWITPETAKYNILCPVKTENLNDVKYIYHRYQFNRSMEWFDYIEDEDDHISEMITSLNIQPQFEKWQTSIYHKKRTFLLSSVKRHYFFKYEYDKINLLDLKDLTVLSHYPNVYHFWHMTNYTTYSPYEIYQTFYKNERIKRLYKEILPLQEFLRTYSLGQFTKGERKLIAYYPPSIRLYSNVFRYISNVDERKKILKYFNETKTIMDIAMRGSNGIESINQAFYHVIVRLRKIFRQYLSSVDTKAVIEKYVIQVTMYFINTKHLSIIGQKRALLSQVMNDINRMTHDITEQLDILLNIDNNQAMRLVQHYAETDQSILNFEQAIHSALRDTYLNGSNLLETDEDFDYSDEIRAIYEDQIEGLNFKLASSPHYLKMLGQLMHICVGSVPYYENSIIDGTAYIIHAYDQQHNICIQVDHYSGDILEMKTYYNQLVGTLGEDTVRKVSQYIVKMKEKQNDNLTKI